MQNMKKLIAMMLMLASVFFIACDDDSKDPLTAEEAQEELAKLGQDMTTMMTDMESVEGIDVMMILMNLPDPFTETSKSNESIQVLNKIENYLLPGTILNKEKSLTKEPDFDFETYKGVYTYHHTPFPYWEITPGGNVIEINFPSDESEMETNDAKLTIYDYSEVEIAEYDDYWGEYYYYNMPTAVQADLYVNSTKLVEIDMTASWNTTGDYAGEPISIDVDVYLIPFEFHVDFLHESKSADINAWIKYNESKIFSTGVGATFTTTNMDDPPQTIKGYIQLFDVKFKATLAFAEFEEIIEALDEGTSTYTTLDEIEAAINATLDAEVTVDGAKAADIVLDFTNVPGSYTFTIDEEEGIYLDILFVYTNGTSESAVPYMAVFVTQLGEFFGFMDGFYGAIEK
jgi:hypothetical protein